MYMTVADSKRNTYHILGRAATYCGIYYEADRGIYRKYHTLHDSMDGNICKICDRIEKRRGLRRA